MPPLEDLFQRLESHGYTGSNPAMTEAVQDAVRDHMLRKIEGPWLFSVVIRAARDHYAANGVEFHDDMALNLEKRLFALARVVARDWHDAAPIAERAMQIFVGRTQGKYLWRVMTNLGHRIYNKFEKKRTLGINFEDLEDHEAEEKQSDDEQAKLILLRCIRLERLRPEVLATYVASQYAYHRPGAIVAFFANLTAAQLCGGLLREVCPMMNAAERNLFRKPLAGAAARTDRAMLGEVWDPLRVVKGWITAPPAGSSREQRAHRTLVHLAGSAGRDEVQIVAGMSGMTLGDVAARVHRTPCGRNVSGKKLGRYYDPRAKVTMWIDYVVGRMRSEVWAQTEGGIHMIVRLNIEPAKLLVFLLCHCLGMPVRQVSDEYRNARLVSLEVRMEQRFCEVSNASPQKARELFASVKKACERDGRTLSQAADAKNPASAMRGWITETLNSVRQRFANGAAPYFAFQYRIVR